MHKNSQKHKINVETLSYYQQLNNIYKSIESKKQNY